MQWFVLLLMLPFFYIANKVICIFAGHIKSLKTFLSDLSAQFRDVLASFIHVSRKNKTKFSSASLTILTEIKKKRFDNQLTMSHK